VKRKRNGYGTRRAEKSRAKGCYPNRFAESSFGIFNIQARRTSIYQVTIRKIVIIIMSQSILNYFSYKSSLLALVVKRYVRNVKIDDWIHYNTLQLIKIQSERYNRILNSHVRVFVLLIIGKLYFYIFNKL